MIVALRMNRASDEFNKRLAKKEDPWNQALDRYATEHADSFQ